VKVRFGIHVKDRLCGIGTDEHKIFRTTSCIDRQIQDVLPIDLVVS